METSDSDPGDARTFVLRGCTALGWPWDEARLPLDSMRWTSLDPEMARWGLQFEEQEETPLWRTYALAFPSPGQLAVHAPGLRPVLDARWAADAARLEALQQEGCCWTWRSAAHSGSMYQPPLGWERLPLESFFALLRSDPEIQRQVVLMAWSGWSRCNMAWQSSRDAEAVSMAVARSLSWCSWQLAALRPLAGRPRGPEVLCAWAQVQAAEWPRGGLAVCPPI